ncbi:MAG: helix-turn-helix domain-containing protein [Pseudomonadota bacterium]
MAIALAVGTTLKVPAFLFFSPSRGTGPIAFARHVAMYIAHVELALPMQRVGEGFGRDRTTVAHACRRIEESREAVEIDRMIVAVRGQVLAELTQQDEGSVPIKQGAPTNAGSQS